MNYQELAGPSLMIGMLLLVASIIVGDVMKKIIPALCLSIFGILLVAPPIIHFVVDSGGTWNLWVGLALSAFCLFFALLAAKIISKK